MVACWGSNTPSRSGRYCAACRHHGSAAPCWKMLKSPHVSQDLISTLLPRVLPAVTEGLQDLDDDVRAVAASALIPVVDGLVQLLPSKVRTTFYIISLGSD